MTRVLGIAASLRNARCGAGSAALLSDLASLESKEALLGYLSGQCRVIVEQFLDAGRREGKSFLEIYRALKRSSGDAGLSNTEVALAAALWAARREGVEIDHLSLGDHFTVDGRVREPAALKAQLLAAGGLLLSGPVYFGDRGSLAESLIAFVAGDPELREALRGRVYGGIAVGAKRNGGQETTLIYQLLDMVNLGLLAVGNDSETTAQYGGTGYAGDVGTMAKDAEGLDTSMGTGRHLARVLRFLGAAAEPVQSVRALFLVLQDARGVAASVVEGLRASFGPALRATVVDVTQRRLDRCVACDICPTRVGLDEEYRCVITSQADAMSELHPQLLGHDLIVPVALSSGLPGDASRYQTFVERTRYLRRSDYVWGDALVAPLILTEGGGLHSLPVRMVTSFIRHHTVMARPLVAQVRQGAIEDLTALEQGFAEALNRAARLAAGRLSLACEDAPAVRYNPVGYLLSAEKSQEDERLGRRLDPSRARRERLLADAQLRLVPPRRAG